MTNLDLTGWAGDRRSFSLWLFCNDAWWSTILAMDGYFLGRILLPGACAGSCQGQISGE